MPDFRSIAPDGATERRVTSSLDDTSWCSYAVTIDGPSAGAYSEESFRYLLAIERKRAERSGHSFFLLLIDLKRVDSHGGMDAVIADQLFTGLTKALRDTDFIG